MKAFEVFKSIFNKELVKTKSCIIGLFIANALFLLWLYVHIRRLFMLDHGEIVWYRVISLEQIPYDMLSFIPMLCGLTYCAFQFIPEMRDERLRLCLHLPYNSNWIILFHLFTGLCFLFLLFGMDILLFAMILHLYFPYEIIILSLYTAAPWFLAGFIAYLSMSIVLLEPQMKRRVFTFFLSIGMLVPLFATKTPGAYTHCIWIYAMIIPLLLIAALLPAFHFRHRSVQ